MSKVLLVVALMVSAVWCQHQRVRAQRGRCRIQTDVVALIKKSQCRPVEQPVPVPVPEGYEVVRPQVVMLPRCSGLACHHANLACVPQPENTRNLTIPVYVYRHGMRRQCSQVEVVVHEGCECGCHKTCPSNQVLRENLCQCVCDPLQQAQCEDRRRLWDSSSCSCKCPPSSETQCSTGQVFIQELCRCENY